MKIISSCPHLIQGKITVPVYGYNWYENMAYKANGNMKKLIHARELSLPIKSHASFSEREGDWVSHTVFTPGMVKKERKRERDEKSCWIC